MFKDNLGFFSLVPGGVCQVPTLSYHFLRLIILFGMYLPICQLSEPGLRFSIHS